MLTVARPTHCMPYAHCYKALSVPNASLHVTRLTGTGHHQRPSYICLSVAMLTVTRHHQCPMPPCHCCKASSVPCHCCKASSVPCNCCKASSVPYASLLQGPLLQGLISALCLPVARLTAASSLPAYLASVLCVIIAFIQRCVGLCFIPVMVWSGLCFIPRRSGLVWSGLVCVLYPTDLQALGARMVAEMAHRVPLPAYRHFIYCRFHFSSNIRGPFPGNVWFVFLANFNVNLWHAQVINFPGTAHERSN